MKNWLVYTVQQQIRITVLELGGSYEQNLKTKMRLDPTQLHIRSFIFPDELWQSLFKLTKSLFGVTKIWTGTVQVRCEGVEQPDKLFLPRQLLFKRFFPIPSEIKIGK